MEHLYGAFTNEQVKREFIKLHKAIHRLLYYYEEGYPNLDNYFESTIRRISGFNSLLYWQDNMIELLSNLQEARNLAKEKECDFASYRKLILDTHNLLDKVEGNIQIYLDKQSNVKTEDK